MAKENRKGVGIEKAKHKSEEEMCIIIQVILLPFNKNYLLLLRQEAHHQFGYTQHEYCSTSLHTSYST